MKKVPESGPDNSVIRTRVTEFQGPIETLYERVYSSFSENEEFDHPPVRLRYMIDDYWELTAKQNVNEAQ